MPKMKLSPIALRDGAPTALPKGAIKRVVFSAPHVIAYVLHRADDPHTTHRTFQFVHGSDAFEETPKHKYLTTVVQPATEGPIHVFELLAPTKEELREQAERKFKGAVLERLREFESAIFGPPPTGFGTQEQIEAERQQYEARKLAILAFAEQRIRQDLGG